MAGAVEHGGREHARSEHGTRAVGVGLGVHALAAGAALGAAATTGSAALTAVGLLLVATAGSHALLLAGGRRARRDAVARHPLAYGRERYFWPYAASVALLAVASAAAVVVGEQARREPEALTSLPWAYGALGGGALLVLVGIQRAVVAANEVRGRAGWRRFLRTATAPPLPLALVLGVGALVGLVAALAGVLVAELADEATADGIAAMAVGGAAGLVALVLVGEMRPLLLGAPATRRDVETIVAAVEIDPSVRRLQHMRTLHLGPGELLVGVRVQLDHELTLPEASEVVHRIERQVRAALPMALVMYVEPDVTDARRAAPAVDEHVPVHAVPEAIRAEQRAEADRGALGAGIPVEEGLR